MITKSIKVSGNTYLARVIGPSAKYGVESEFLRPTKQVSRKLAYFDVGPGVYKHDAGEAECDNRRRDTGYLHITEAGDTREITQAEALAIVAEIEAANNPAAVKARAINQIREMMAKHGVSIADIEAAARAAKE